MTARRSDYIVIRIEHSCASKFIKDQHYSKGCSNTSVHSFGMMRSGELVGVTQWLPPTKVCAQKTSGDNWRRVISLSRMVVKDGEPKNATSILLGWSIRLLKSDLRWDTVVTFADAGQGHTGHIYRVCNFSYVGSRETDRWLDSEGKQVAKLSTKSRSNKTMNCLGYIKSKTVKHKFILRLRKGDPDDDRA